MSVEHGTTGVWSMAVLLNTVQYFVGEESADETGANKEPVSKKETEASKKSDKKNK